MKYLFFILFLITSSTSFAEDLIMLSPSIKEIGQSQNQRKNLITNQKDTLYCYAGSFILKNNGSKPVVVVTEFQDKSIHRNLYSTGPNDSYFIVSVGHSTKVMGAGKIVFPEESELSLKTLRPGESVKLTFEVESSSFVGRLDRVKYVYEIKDFYNGHFGYWTGELKSKVFKVIK